MTNLDKDDLQYRTKRLQTFTEGVRIGNSKSAKQWTLTLVDVNHLADLGFYYSPTRKFPNQITCFWCGKKEKNLEAVLSVTEFHLANSKQCPYAQIASNLEKFVVDSNKDQYWQKLAASGGATLSILHPHSIPSTQLRQSTFKSLWKLDKKRKCKVTSRTLAKAGFYYSPLDPGSDRVICMYCDCPLEEWDPSDDPLEEHKNNSFTYCYFLDTIGKEPIAIGEPEPENEEEANSTNNAEGNASTASQADTKSDYFDATTENVLEDSPMNLTIRAHASGTPSPNVTTRQLAASEFDAFDFSVEDLENHDLATIFNDKKFQKKNPRRYQKRSDPDQLPAYKPKVRRLDSGTSLVLEIKPEQHLNGDTDVEKDEHPAGNTDDTLGELAFHHDHQMSKEEEISVDQEPSEQTAEEQTTKGNGDSDSFDLSAFQEEEESEFTPSNSSSAVSPVKETLQPETKKRKVANSRAGSSKSKKSLFSDDDELGLNQAQLEEILNSPRKSRKMKKLETNAETSAQVIYDLSNQNIGDYEEENISFLENDIHINKKAVSEESVQSNGMSNSEKNKLNTPKKKSKRSLQDQLDDMVKDSSRTFKKLKQLDNGKECEITPLGTPTSQNDPEGSMVEMPLDFPTTSTPTKEHPGNIEAPENGGNLKEDDHQTTETHEGVERLGKELRVDATKGDEPKDGEIEHSSVPSDGNLTLKQTEETQPETQVEVADKEVTNDLNEISEDSISASTSLASSVTDGTSKGLDLELKSPTDQKIDDPSEPMEGQFSEKIQELSYRDAEVEEEGTHNAEENISNSAAQSPLQEETFSSFKSDIEEKVQSSVKKDDSIVEKRAKSQFDDSTIDEIVLQAGKGNSGEGVSLIESELGQTEEVDTQMEETEKIEPTKEEEVHEELEQEINAKSVEYQEANGSDSGEDQSLDATTGLQRSDAVEKGVMTEVDTEDNLKNNSEAKPQQNTEEELLDKTEISELKVEALLALEIEKGAQLPSEGSAIAESTINMEDQSAIRNMTLSPSSYNEYVRDVRGMEAEFTEESVLEKLPPDEKENDESSISTSHSEPSIIADSVSELPQISSQSPSKTAASPEITNGEKQTSSETEAERVRHSDRSVKEAHLEMHSAELEETKEIKTLSDEAENEAKVGAAAAESVTLELSENEKSPSPPPKTFPLRKFPISSPRKIVSSSVGDYEDSGEASSLHRISFTDVEASTPQPKKKIIHANYKEADINGTEIGSSVHSNGDKRLSSSHRKNEGNISAPTIPQIKLDNISAEFQTLLDTIEYLAEVSATLRELHNDAEGLLTEFIAAMPEEEESMSIQEWIHHNAATCGRTVRDISERLIQSYEDQFDKVIEAVENMETRD